MEIQELIKQKKEYREEFTLKLIERFKSGEEHLSYSSFKHFLESPYSFITYKMGGKYKSDEMNFGNALHMAVFKRDEFNKTYVTDEEIIQEIGGSKPRATNKYKDWLSSLGDKTLCQAEDFETIILMANALWENKASESLLCQVNRFEEKSEFVYNGFRFKLYHDAIGDIHLDLKSTKSAEQKKFTRDVFNLGYNLQASIYVLDNLVKTGEQLPYWNIAEEKSCNISCFEYSENVINFGIKKLERGLKDFQRCLDENLFYQSFEFYSPNEKGYFLIDLPPWLS